MPPRRTGRSAEAPTRRASARGRRSRSSTSRTRSAIALLAARLAKGIYAKPGVYPATVRFANAASTIYSDSEPDLRALSFSVELPPGLAANTNYQDYSLQSARTFPINDAHTFAVLMKVLSAGSGANKLKAIWSLSFADFCRFAKAAALGAWQEHGKTRAYQQMRYWSTVPYRNGPFEAVQYSAIPSAGNPAHDLQTGPNALQDELVRHLDEDERMSSFDIALQLLDTAQMTRWGIAPRCQLLDRKRERRVEGIAGAFPRRRTAHTGGQVGAACRGLRAAKYIDVTEHSTPDSQPLGSINRARCGRGGGEPQSAPRRGDRRSDRGGAAGGRARSPLPAPQPR